MKGFRIIALTTTIGVLACLTPAMADTSSAEDALQSIYATVNGRPPEGGPAPDGWRALLARGVPSRDVCLLIASQIEGITKNGGMFESYQRCDAFR